LKDETLRVFVPTSLVCAVMNPQRTGSIHYAALLSQWVIQQLYKHREPLMARHS